MPASPQPIRPPVPVWPCVRCGHETETPSALRTDADSAAAATVVVERGIKGSVISVLHGWKSMAGALEYVGFDEPYVVLFHRALLWRPGAGWRWPIITSHSGTPPAALGNCRRRQSQPTVVPNSSTSRISLNSVTAAFLLQFRCGCDGDGRPTQ